MTTSMFGSPLGFQEYDKGLANESLARVHNANAANLESQTAREQRMMELLARPEQVAGPQQSGSPEGMMMQLGRQGTPLEAATARLGDDANKLLKAGFLKEGTTAAKAVSEIYLKGQQQLTAKSQAAYRDNQVLHANAKELNALFSGVTDAASFERAKILYTARHPEDPIPPQMATYSPELVSSIVNGTTEGMKRLELALKAEESDSRDSLRVARENFMKWRKKHTKTVDKIRLDQAAVKAKAGKDVGSPSQDLVEQAKRLVREEYKDAALPPSEVATAGYDIAARAKAIRKANPGIDDGTALRQALGEAAKDFKPVADTYLGSEVLGRLAEKTRKGYRRGIPGPTPKGSDGKTDPSKLVIGESYVLGNGTVGVWTVQGYEPVRGAAPESGVSVPDLADGSDDDDEEE